MSFKVNPPPTRKRPKSTPAPTGKPHRLEDDSAMPYGEYAGHDMQDVPARYLVWVRSNKALQKSRKWASVIAYIHRRWESIQNEL